MFETAVLLGADFVPATFEIASAADRSELAGWSGLYGEVATQDTSDILEYVHFALHKHEYYTEKNRCPETWNRLVEMIGNDPQAECGLLLALKCTATPEMQLLGFAFARRTWANNLVVDFLAKNPGAAARNPRPKALGGAILQGLLRAADALEAQVFWGEATSTSAQFYRDEFTMPAISDLFAVSRERYQTYLQELS